MERAASFQRPNPEHTRHYRLQGATATEGSCNKAGGGHDLFMRRGRDMSLA